MHIRGAIVRILKNASFKSLPETTVLYKCTTTPFVYLLSGMGTIARAGYTEDIAPSKNIDPYIHNGLQRMFATGHTNYTPASLL